jgi:hypothetical protein
VTILAIDGTDFLIDGRPTYQGRQWNGYRVEGLLLNSRMVQAIFDDENPQTRKLWAYPDTGRWDPDRNTDEFCAALPTYRGHGLLAVTVGLQGGGSIYTGGVYDRYINSAFAPDGSLKPAYFDRLRRIVAAADTAGMVVIVNYFYWRQATRFESEAAIIKATRAASDWLLASGHRNVFVDVVNESGVGQPPEIMLPDRVDELIEVVQQTTRDGRRLLVGCSTGGGDSLPAGRWREIEDIALPHGNGCSPEQLAAKLRRLRETPEHRARPRPICVNEDSVFTENLDAAVARGCSWGFYCQGYGSDYRDRMDWKAHPRETAMEDLSGYQTLPVNWGINTPVKQAFFDRVAEITGSQPARAS